MLTINYKPLPADQDALVDGGEIRSIRIRAGFKTQTGFARACGWSQTSQYKYEKAGRNTVKLAHIFKMIRVCNGSQ